MRHGTPLISLLSCILAACASTPPSGVDWSSPRALQVLTFSGPAPIAIVDGHVAPLADGSRVTLLERTQDGREREAAIWRRGFLYEVVIRHGDTFGGMREEDLEWIAASLDLRDAEFFSTDEAGFERTRIDAARVALRAPELDLESVRSDAPQFAFPSLLVPDLIAAVRRERLSDVEEAALVALCFEELNLPPTPERAELLAALGDRASLSLRARCALVRHLDAFPEDRRTERARRLVTLPAPSPVVAARIMQHLDLLPPDDGAPFVHEIVARMPPGPDFHRAVLAELTVNGFLIDTELERVRPQLVVPMSDQRAVAVLESLTPCAPRPHFSYLPGMAGLTRRGTLARERYSVAYEEALLACFVARWDLSPVEQSALATCVIDAHVNVHQSGTVLGLLLANPTCTDLARATLRERRGSLTVAQRAELAPLLGD